jgi:hypothetical protein
MRCNDVPAHAKNKDGDYLFPHMRNNETLNRKLERITKGMTFNQERTKEEPQHEIKPFNLGPGFD